MTEALNMLYRLFAPLLVVIVIIVGVDLSSGLIKNTQEKQTAISIAHAAGTCTLGITAIQPPVCKLDPKTGQCILGQVCTATAYGTTVTGFYIPGPNCCQATSWGGAGAAKAVGGQAVLGQMVKGLMDFLKPKPSSGGAADNKPEPPVCQSLAVSPTLPLDPGDSATLTWTLGGGKADTIIVSPGVGAVVGFSTRVSPRVSTTYTVTATNEGGTATCAKVRVYVGPNRDADDEAFENTNTGSGDVDIWSDGGVDNGAAQNATRSAYDDLWDGNAQQGVTGQGGTNDGDDYYDFLSSLASDEEGQEQPADYSEYYYGDGGEEFNWSDLDGTEPSWDNVDLQEGYIGETDANGLNLGMREDNYDYYDEYDYGVQNTNGLTNEEIYGVWNRPQSPATGGLGLSGGFGSSSGDVSVDLSVDEESTSIFGRIGRWFKNTFCFWCSNSFYTDSADQAATISFSPQLLTGNRTNSFEISTGDNVTVPLPGPVLTETKAAATMPEITQSGIGQLPSHSNPKVLTWGTGDKMQKLSITALDYGPKRAVLFNNSSVKVEIKNKFNTALSSTGFLIARNPSNAHVVEVSARQIFNTAHSNGKPYDSINKGERVGTAPILVKCNAEHLTLVGTKEKFDVSQTRATSQSVAFKQKVSSNTESGLTKRFTLKDGEITDALPELFGYQVACGSVKVASAKKLDYTPVKIVPEDTTKTERVCHTGLKGVQICEEVVKTAEKKETGKEQFCVQFNGQKICEDDKTSASQSEKVDPRIAYKADCNSKGGKFVQTGTRSYGCKRIADDTEEDTQRRIAKARRAEQARAQAVINKQAENNKKAQQAQAQQYQAAQKKAQQANAQRQAQAKQQAQQRANTQQQPPQGWLQELIARLRGDDKPQCSSFTSDDTDIESGEEITLQWAVSGATKIIITPKVTVVTKDGKKVANASPESSVKRTTSDGRTVGYTLIATNDTGGEERCYTEPIIVDDDDDDPEDDLSCEGSIDSLSISTDPSTVNREACDPEQGDEECENDWEGKEIQVSWDVEPQQCVTSCKIQLQPESEDDWIDVWTTNSDMKHTLDSEEDGFSNRGLLRETSTFKLKCEDGDGNIEEDTVEARVTQEV